MKVAVKETNSYLTKSKIGQYAINPYVGCPHACKYCYASFMKRFTGHAEPWGEFLDVKLPQRSIDTEKIIGKNVFMGTVTDCYNSFESKYEATRSVLTQLADVDCYLQIATKSDLILRDIDLLKRMRHLSVALSVNTLNEQFRRDMDNGSPIERRLEALRTLHREGIYTILFMSPIFIGITEWREIIEQTKSYVNEFWFEDLNLRGGYKAVIMEYVKEHYPALYPLYEQIYSRGNRSPLDAIGNEIKQYCTDNDIVFSDYFHHKEVITNSKITILGKKR